MAWNERSFDRSDNAVIAKRAGAKTLVLTHLLSQIDQPAVREQIVHEIRQTFDGRVIWGEDLMRLTVTSAGVAGIESRRGSRISIGYHDFESTELPRPSLEVP